MIDSEQVPWGKGEKQPGEGDEIVSETICLQRVGAGRKRGDGVPIEEWANEFVNAALLKSEQDESAVKARVNSPCGVFFFGKRQINPNK